MEKQDRTDSAKRRLIDEFKALLIEHRQSPMSVSQTSLLARQPIAEIQANFDRTKAALERAQAKP